MKTTRLNTWILVLGLIAAPFARADMTERLVEVTSDAFPSNVFQFAVGTDDSGDITSISYSGSSESYTLDQLRGGVVLMHNASPSRDVILLSIDSQFEGKDGGYVYIDYLNNGLTNPHGYGRFTLELVRGGVTWLPYAVSGGSRADNPFGHLRFVARRFFGRVVGVAYVQAW
jgi:hypothetical protein